jgi:hypothetical protein
LLNAIRTRDAGRFERTVRRTHADSWTNSTTT